MRMEFAEHITDDPGCAEVQRRQQRSDLLGDEAREPADRDATGRITALHFRGRGWGHGVGMCQVGAIGMAEAGQSAQEILEHYYRGAAVRSVY